MKGNLTKTEFDDICAWGIDLHYEENLDKAIGYLHLKFKIRDDDGKIKGFHSKMNDADGKKLCRHYIDFLSSPCPDYYEDMIFDYWYEEEDDSLNCYAEFRT